MARKKRGMKPRALISALFAVLVISALIEQLRRPKEERTWQGSVLGVPYDFRLPTLEKLRNTFWNEKTSQILVPQAFGMGWSINFYPLVHPQSRSASV